MTLFNWFVATIMDEVGVSWFDFYSIGHICFGIAVFLFLSLFYTIPKAKGDIPLFSLTFVFILTLIVLIAWELIENVLFVYLDTIWNTSIKFEGRPDSLQNIFTDLLCGVIGALGIWLFAHIIFEKNRKIWPYYIFGIIGFSLWLGVFIILRYLTLMNSPIFS